MPDISKITLPSGNTYDIKDAAAREAIASLSGGSYFLGVSETPIIDQSTTSPIYVNGEYVYPVNGNMAIYGSKEFVWSTTQYLYYSKQLTSDTPPKYYYTLIASPTQAQKDAAVFTTSRSIPTTSSGAISEPLADGADIIKAQYSGKWVEFGDTSTLGDLAYKDTVSVSSTINTSGNTASAITGLSQGRLVCEHSVGIPVIGGLNSAKLITQSSPVVSALSSVSASTSKLVTTSIPNVTSIGSASTWGFAMGSGTDAETLVISGANGSAPTLGTAITAATGSLSMNGGGSSVATGVMGSALSSGILGAPTGKTVGDTVTIASGSISANGTGSTVVTGATNTNVAMSTPSDYGEGDDLYFASGSVDQDGTGSLVVTGSSGTATVLKSTATITNTVTTS